MSKETKLPLKWLAPEVFFNGFSTCSDVWAFGILTWEIITRGLSPYGDLSFKNWPELKTHLEKGNRLKKPIHCDTQLYNMMMRCWEFERRNRPTFSELSEFLSRHYKKLASNAFEKNTEHEAEMPQLIDFDLTYVYKAAPLDYRKTCPLSDTVFSEVTPELPEKKPNSCEIHVPNFVVYQNMPVSSQMTMPETVESDIQSPQDHNEIIYLQPNPES